MSLESSDFVFNTSIRFKEPLDIPEKAVKGLFDEIVNVFPALNDYNRQGKDFHLIERIAGQTVRQILVREKAITLAIAPPRHLREAHETATRIYPLIARNINPPPLLIEFLDVSFRFRFPYRGNHDNLVLRGLFGNTPYAQIAE